MVETEKRKYTIVLMVDPAFKERKVMHEITQALMFYDFDVDAIISEQEPVK